ncbi:unnamed protein product [Linum tenue]|uniref:Uncharacterized protein n=1 Tax=Linum tenue TaxID=586396 RepID=A0AAV0GNM0_9ROSI|nr:unnamed protein product [Linum tenue]
MSSQQESQLGCGTSRLHELHNLPLCLPPSQPATASSITSRQPNRRRYAAAISAALSFRCWSTTTTIELHDGTCPVLSVSN